MSDLMPDLRTRREQVMKEIADFNRIYSMIQRSLQAELDELERKIVVRETIHAMKERMGD